MSLKKLFGSQVKLLRNYRNMTQEELSEKINIDIRQLARIEAGESFATSETIERLTMALNVTYKELFDVDNIEKNKISDDITVFKKNYMKLHKLIQKISVSDEKTEYILLASEALEKRSARERLKSLLLGMTLK